MKHARLHLANTKVKMSNSSIVNTGPKNKISAHITLLKNFQICKLNDKKPKQIADPADLAYY